jgi:hypothetical protein
MLAAFRMFGHLVLIPVPDLDRTDYFLIFGANPGRVERQPHDRAGRHATSASDLSETARRGLITQSVLSRARPHRCRRAHCRHIRSRRSTPPLRPHRRMAIERRRSQLQPGPNHEFVALFCVAVRCRCRYRLPLSAKNHARVVAGWPRKRGRSSSGRLFD